MAYATTIYGSTMIDSKKIVKNTAFLYIRLILVFGVTFYTSRVVLDQLGVEDYGLYNVIYGIIGVLSFLNGTLSIGTTRFLTYDLGASDDKTLKDTFMTALTCHLILAFIIFIIGETIGLWYVCNVMVCPEDRFFSALFTYQMSILVTMLTIIQVPFSSEIIAHEEMNLYAYLGIFEAFANLFVAIFLSISTWDKLVIYAFLIFFVKMCTSSLYIFITRRKFQEVKLKLGYNSSTLRKLLNFSGWNIIANISSMLMNQGVIMLFNLFFAPVVVAAQAIANQISQALLLLVNNVRQAINPQVIKLYADNKRDESERLTLNSAEYVFYLLLLIGIPLIVLMPEVLNLWLVDVPDYTIIFSQFIVLQTILDNFNAAFYTPMLAANKIKANSLIAAVLCVLQFLLLTILFRFGFDAIWSRYVGILFCIVWSFFVKPFILWKYIGYSKTGILRCIFRCLRLFIAVTVVTLCINDLISKETTFDIFVVGFLSIINVLFWTVVFMKSDIRIKILNLIINKIKSKS